MSPRALAAALSLGLLSLTAGCGTDQQPVTAPLGTQPQPQPPPPACTDLFVDGRPTPQPSSPAADSVPCARSGGGVYLASGHRCGDGGFLWAIGGGTAPVTGYGRAGAAFHATHGLGDDPGYGAAYRACTARP